MFSRGGGFVFCFVAAEAALAEFVERSSTVMERAQIAENAIPPSFLVPFMKCPFPQCITQTEFHEFLYSERIRGILPERRAPALRDYKRIPPRRAGALRSA